MAWQLFASAARINGKRRYPGRFNPAQSKTFNTKAEAEAWAGVIESEMACGVWMSRGEAESTTLREALERYQAEIVPHKKGKVQ